MAESADAAGGGQLKKLAKKALAPLASTLVHAASAYLGRKAGELAQEKLLPMLRERGGGEQRAESSEPREAERRDREKRRTSRRKALEQSGSS